MVLIVCAIVVWVVVASVLTKRVVFYDYALYFLHIFYFDHLNTALVNYLLKTWFVCTCVELVLRLI
jgi:hypothetical protein